MVSEKEKRVKPSPEALETARIGLRSLVAGLIDHKKEMADHVTTVLFDQPAKPTKPGGPPGHHTAFKQAVIQHFGDHFPNSIHLNNTTFQVFLGKMALRYVREQRTPPSIDLYLALIDFCLAVFDLLKEAGINNSSIKKIHIYSLPEVQEILDEIQTTFGKDPKTRPLIKTVRTLIFIKAYPSVTIAKEAYDKAFKKAQEIFGVDKETEPLVRTAANLVFKKIYPSVAAAKEAYDEALQKAETIFGVDKKTQPLVRTAAHLVLKKTYPSVKAVKTRYDEILQEVQEIFGQKEKTQPLVRTVADLVLEKKHPSVTAAKKAYDKALREAQRIFGKEKETRFLVRTAARLVLEKKYPSITVAKEMYNEINQAMLTLKGGQPNIKRTQILDLWKSPQSPETQGILKRYKALEEKNGATPPTDASKFHRGRRR